MTQIDVQPKHALSLSESTGCGVITCPFTCGDKFDCVCSFMLIVFKKTTGARMWLLYIAVCGGFSDDVNYVPVWFIQDGDRALWIALAICNYHVWCRLSLVFMLLFLTGHFIPSSLSKFVCKTSVILCDKLDFSLSHFFCFLLPSVQNYKIFLACLCFLIIAYTVLLLYLYCCYFRTEFFSFWVLHYL